MKRDLIALGNPTVADLQRLIDSKTGVQSLITSEVGVFADHCSICIHLENDRHQTIVYALPIPVAKILSQDLAEAVHAYLDHWEQK